jgi:hypothetical protein
MKDIIKTSDLPRGKQCVRCGAFSDCNQVRMWEKGAVVLVDLCPTCTTGLHKAIGAYVSELGRVINAYKPKE